MVKWKKLLAIISVVAVASSVPAQAAGWQWLDTNQDNIRECYYIQDDGTVLTGTATIDGYTVNEQGAWMVDGVVQTQQVQTSTAPARTTEYSMKTSQLDQFRYLLYSPRNATDNMSLIIYLVHGMNDDMDRLEEDLSKLRKDANRRSSAYILAPMLPAELDYGAKGMWLGIEDSLMELIDFIITTYSIDRDKVSIIGESAGADAAIQIAAAHPETFSCVAGIVPFHQNSPIAKWEPEWGEKLKTTSTWLFVEDLPAATSRGQAAVDGINAAGGQAWLEILPGTDHRSASKLMNTKIGLGGYAVYDWMVSVSKVREQNN